MWFVDGGIVPGSLNDIIEANLLFCFNIMLIDTKHSNNYKLYKNIILYSYRYDKMQKS